MSDKSAQLIVNIMKSQWPNYPIDTGYKSYYMFIPKNEKHIADQIRELTDGLLWPNVNKNRDIMISFSAKEIFR